MMENEHHRSFIQHHQTLHWHTQLTTAVHGAMKTQTAHIDYQKAKKKQPTEETTYYRLSLIWKLKSALSICVKNSTSCLG